MSGRKLIDRAWESRTFARALALIGPLLATVGSTSAWSFRTGYARQQLGHLGAAATYFEQAVAAHPAPPAQWQIRLAHAWLGTGRNKDALDLLVRVTADADHGESAHTQLLSALEGTNQWDWALEAFRNLARAGAGDPEVAARRYLDVVSLHPTLGRQESLEACDWAVTLGRDGADVLLRATELRLSHNDLDGALNAIRAIEVDDEPALPAIANLRIEVADALWAAHRFSEACQLLRRTADRHTGHAATFQKLGHIALDAADWHRLGNEAAQQRVTHHSQESTAWPDEDATAFLSLACWALEHAVRLTGDRLYLHAALARARERRGYWEGAASSYDHLTERARSSTRRRIVRNLHGWEFRQERAYHRMGTPRVADPLFAARVEPLPGDGTEAAAGIYRLSFTAMGARLQGRLSRPTESIRVMVDGHLLRQERVGGAGSAPRFGLILRRGTLDAFPQESTLTVTTSGDQLLATTEGGDGYHVHLPHGDGSLIPLLQAGQRLDKKGRIAPTLDDIHRRQDRYLELYDRVRTFFDDELGIQCFILYGTLLGLHRDGDFIPSDDDFDCGYMSDQSNPSDVKDEMKEVIGRLLEAGFVISFNRRGRLFRVSDPEELQDGIHLDTRPAWFEDGLLWMHNHVRYPSQRDDWLPALEREFRHTKVYVPRDVESFLEAHYGPGWKTPDPSFTYYSDEMDPTIHQHLSEALITPAEYRRWKQDFEESLGSARAANFLSVAEAPLYPLTGLID